MNNKLNFHSRIEFDILRQTPKALLIKVESVCEKLEKVYDDYGPDVLEPVEMWIPKSWIKIDQGQAWVWTEGFIKNMKKLAEKRLSNLEVRDRAIKIDMDEIIPEGVTIH